MKKITLAFLLLVSATALHAQLNLVRNPSFEDTLGCPTDLNDDIFLTKYWSSLDSTWNSDSISHVIFHTPWDVPDFEHFCANGHSGGCPDNYFFHHYPRTGNAMVEMLLYSSYNSCFGRDEWNHLQGRLQNRLSSGRSYCVTFYVTMEQSSGYAINKIAAYLDDGSIDTTYNPGRALPYIAPQVVDTVVINDTLNWVKIQGCFTAVGNENFITIGVFSDSSTITASLLGHGCLAVYLVDDISVIPLDSSAQAGPDKVTHHAGDTVQLGVLNGEGMPCYWYNKGFAAPIDSGGTLVVHPDTTTSYVVMMDLCGHITYDTVTVTVHTVGIANVLPSLKWVSVYPNPASSTVTIEAPAGCEVYINDIVGSTVYTASLMEAKTAVPIDALQPGVYFITVADPVSGGKVVKRVVKE